MRHAWPLAATLLLAGCGGTSQAAGIATPSTITSSSTASSGTPGPTTPAGATAPSPKAPSPSPARQLITVTASSYSATTATLVGYDGSKKALGPWTVHLGRAGLARPGAKHEGDLHTPSGTFGISYMFGWKPSPGVKFRYRVAHSYDTWSDDSASPYYNLWVDSRYHDPGAAPEHMKSRYYAYGIVIAYNAARTPHRGSAVFLHVDHASPTTGCVTLPTDRLVQVMRWLNPARSPQIKIGVTS